MYRPTAFEETRSDVLASFVEAHPFGSLITHGQVGLSIDYLPFLIETNGTSPGRLRGHIARANPLWRDLPGGASAMVAFRGADHYITPNWYPSKRDHGEAVPTWNYSVVHVRGRVQFFQDGERLRALVRALTERHERGLPHPWSIDDAPERYLERMLKAIVGVEVEIDEMVGKFKCSQNRDQADRDGVREGLSAQGLASGLIAELVR